MSRTAHDALRDFLEARSVARRTHALGDELAKLSLEIADRARQCWEESRTLLDACERYIREYAHFLDAEDAESRWPRGLAAEIRDALDRRDDDLTTRSGRDTV
jgi:hypothetical protein